jgi:O-antigen/teichoic acid export membrane protein
MRARLGKGVAWSLAGTVATNGGTFALNVIVANLLGRQVFGEYAMLQSTWLMIAAVAQLATGYTATKHVAEFRSSDPARTGRVLGVCTVVSAVAATLAAAALLAGAPVLAARALAAPHLAPGLVPAAAVVLFTVMAGYQTGALAGLEAYRPLAGTGLLSGLAQLAAGGAGAWFWGLEGALWGAVGGALLRWLLLQDVLRRESARHGIAITYGELRRESGILVGFALPAALSGLVAPPAQWLASALLVRQPGGYEQMALFSAANSFRILVVFLPYVVNGVGMAVLNNEKGRGDDARYRRVFWANLAVTVTAAAVGAASAVLAGPWLLGVYGSSFGEGYPVLRVLMLAAVPEILAAAVFQVVQTHGRIWRTLFTIVLPREGTIALGSFLLSPRYGAVGLAWAHVAAWGVGLLLSLQLARRVGLGTEPADARRREPATAR